MTTTKAKATASQTKKADTKATTKQAAQPKLKLIEGATAINAAIASIAKRGKQWERDVHVTAVSCLVHADKHGDITLAEKLVQALGKSNRANALRDWFIAHGRFDYDTTAKAFKYAGKKSTKIIEAMATPFWEFKPEAEYVPFDLVAAMQSLVRRAHKAKERGDKVPAQLLNVLENMVEDPLAKAA